MPKIIIHRRSDRTDDTMLQVNGKKLILARNEEHYVTQDQLDTLLLSHEKPYIEVFGEPWIPPEEMSDIRAERAMENSFEAMKESPLSKMARAFGKPR
jgi:hypothetical protein